MEKENKKIDEFQLVEVPASMTIAIQTPEKEILTMEQAMVRVLNVLDKLDKKL